MSESIWSRIATLIRSNINALISSAEEPDKILNQLVIDMRKQYVEARKQVAVAIADEKRLKRQYDKEAERAADWEKKAMTAVRAGKDDLAREALKRKGEADNIAGEFKKQWAAQQNATEQLKESLKRLNDKIQEASRKKNLLIARQKRAETQKKIQDTMSGMGESGAFDQFARMEEKVDRIEAEADAAVELSGDLDGDALANEFKLLEASGAGQDEALAELKAKMGLAPAPAALPPAQATVEIQEEEDLEAVLEDL